MVMFNPWIILGIVLLIAGAGVTGYLKGSKHAQDAARAAHSVALESAIKDANERAQIDARALIDHERDRQAVRTVYGDKIRTIPETITNAPTNCTVPADYRVRLNAIIDTANSAAITIDAKLPAVAPAGK